MKTHKQIESYHCAKGTIADDGLHQLRLYLISLCHDMHPGTLQLPLFEQFCDAILIRANESSSYAYTVCEWALNNGAKHCSPAYNSIPLNYWNQGPPEHWETNKKRSLKQWYRWLSDRMTPMLFNAESTIASIDPQWIVNGNGRYVGTYPKRIARYVKDHYGYQLTPSHIETIGTILKEHVNEAEQVYLTFDRDYIDGASAEYGNGGSCWWGGDYNSGRYALHDAGGFAIREWRSIDDDNQYPIGRCWFLKLDNGYDGFALFNAYGRSLVSFARLLATKYGLSYRIVRMKSAEANAYINNSQGVIIASGDVIDAMSDMTCITLPLYGTVEYCDRCGCMCDELNHGLCESCHTEQYTSCYRCEQLIHIEDEDRIVTEDGNDYCCESCAERSHYQRCYECEEWHQDTILAINEEVYCETCADRLNLIHCCNDCELYSDETTSTQSGEVCNDCRDAYHECEECNQLARMQTGLDICPTCILNPKELECSQTN